MWVLKKRGDVCEFRRQQLAATPTFHRHPPLPPPSRGMPPRHAVLRSVVLLPAAWKWPRQLVTCNLHASPTGVECSLSLTECLPLPGGSRRPQQRLRTDVPPPAVIVTQSLIRATTPSQESPPPHPGGSPESPHRTTCFVSVSMINRDTVTTYK